MSKCLKLFIDQDGSYKLVPDQQPDLKQCDYVLQTGGEVSNSLVDLTPAQASEISVAVGTLWATAWVFRQLANILKGNEHETE